LGTLDHADELEVTWPLGKLERFTELKAGTPVTIQEGTGGAASRFVTLKKKKADHRGTEDTEEHRDRNRRTNKKRRGEDLPDLEVPALYGSCGVAAP